MANYYLNKRQAYMLIDQMYRDGKTEEEITFKVQRMFGFGKKMVNDTLELLENMSKNTQNQKKEGGKR